MKGQMTRGRSQVLWRYTPGAIFRYNDDNAWCVVTSVQMNKPFPLEGVLADALADKLAFWRAIGPTGYPDPRSQPHKYIVGEPYWVHYDIWPIVFICKQCKRAHWWNSVEKLTSTNNLLRCRSCGTVNEILTQIPFAFVHECGNIDTPFVHQCPYDSKHPVGLVDKRTFQDSYWYCQTCNIHLQKTPKEGLGFRACKCGKAMRGIILIDPRIYYSQTIAIVDIQPDILNIWQENKDFPTLLLGACLRTPSYKTSDIQNLARHQSNDSSIAPQILAMKNQLLESGMPEDKIDEIIKKSSEDPAADPWGQYSADLSACQKYISTFEPAQSRQTLEYVFVRDEPKSMQFTMDNLITEANAKNDNDSALKISNDKDLALSLGLVNLAIVQELPILLAGVGFTRWFPSPLDFDGTSNNAELNPYPTNEKGKIPIYVAKNTTEALMYELDPWRVATFLEVNGASAIPDEVKSDEHILRSWLVSISQRLFDVGEAHLQLLTFEKERGEVIDLPAALIFGLLHTISHALKSTAHQYVGIDQDSLAEYLFPGHIAGLLYASSHVKFTLGGIDAVFRSNLEQWLGTLRDFVNICSFDPVCSQTGGACLACLYTKFGCNYFNRSLSRAFLFGGYVKGLDKDIVGYWSPQVKEITLNLKNNAVTL